MESKLLRKIQNTEFVHEELFKLCDFEALYDDKEPFWFRLDSGEEFQPIGRDGAGGWYIVCSTAGFQEGVIFVSSEGQADTISPSIRDFLEMIVAIPYWRDCLKFSRKGILDEMKRASVLLEEDLLKQYPQVQKTRNHLYEILEIHPPLTPVESLHSIVSNPKAAKVVAIDDGLQLETLFNRFTVEDNPLWRSKIDGKKAG